MTEKTRILKENQMLGDFQALAEFTLARILMFNKRRVSEASRLLISQYCTRPDWGIKNSEMVAALQPIERHLMKHMNLVEVLGKKGRRVPVLMTVSMTNAVQALIENRPAGIKSVNPHVFPQGDFNHMRGSDVIRKTVLAADLKEPTLITTTSLRKYLATVSQIFGLTTKDLEELARHMGHELSVHKQFYRLQDDVIEMAKISRLLIAVEEGKVAQFKNKQLDDISLEHIVLEEENEEQGEWDGEDELNQGKSIDTIQGAPDSVPVPPLSDGSDIDLEEEKNQGIEWDGEDDQPLSTPSDAGLPSVVLVFLARPYQRGFYCDDQSLMHPHLGETVPVVVVGVFSTIVPIAMVYLTENYRSGRRCRLPNEMLFLCRKFLMPYFFGCCLTQLVTDVAKYSVGRLRPHFLTVCQPMIQNCSIETGFVYGEGVCKGADLDVITEARLSFPSGHSSMSFYTVIWLMVYLQYRFPWLRYWLVRPVIQGVLFVLAYYVALSRISDYMHHWSDVLAGSIIGIVAAFVVFFLFTEYEERQLLPTSDQENSSRPPSVKLNIQDAYEVNSE